MFELIKEKLEGEVKVESVRMFWKYILKCMYIKA